MNEYMDIKYEYDECNCNLLLVLPEDFVKDRSFHRVHNIKYKKVILLPDDHSHNKLSLEYIKKNIEAGASYQANLFSKFEILDF